MTKTQKSLTIAAILVVLGAGAVGVNAVFASQHGSGRSGAMSGIVNAISQKFHLSPADVQAVIDEHHRQMTEQMKKQMEERFASFLAQAVKDGKLTQVQADAVISKVAELKNFKAGLAGKTPEERQSAMKTEMDALKQWARDNGIPEQFMGLRGFGMQKGGFMSKGSRLMK